MKNELVSSIIIGAIVLIGCRSIKPERPNLPVEPIAVQPLPPSNIDVPISIDLTSTFAELESNVPTAMNSDNWPNMQGSGNCRVEYKWSFSRTPLSISLAGQTINVSSIGSYGAGARVRPCCGWLCPWFGVSCGTKNLKNLKPELLKYGYTKATLDSLDKYLGDQDQIISTPNKEFNKRVLEKTISREPPRQIAIGISSKVSLENNYQLKTSTSLSQFEPQNRCELTFLRIDVTNKIIEKARPKIDDALAKFDVKMGGYNFRSRIEPVWSKLFEPIKISSIGYLIINPERVRLSTLNGNGNTVNFSVGLTASPAFTLSDPGPQNPLPLPDISSNEPGNGFNVYVDGKLEYPPLTALINQQINTIGNIPIQNIGYIKLNNATVFGTGSSKILIKVNLRGKVKNMKYKGWVYLSGIPSYDPSTGELSLKDLDYTLETRNVLLRLANWLLGSRLQQMLQEKAKWNISPTLENLKNDLTAALNRDLSPDIKLQGEVTNLNIAGFQARRDFLLLRVNTVGQVKINVRQPGI